MKNCPSAWTCRSCGTKHHTLLHYEQSSNTTPKTEPISATPAEPDAVPAPQSEDAPIVTMTSLANRIVLLSTVRAEAMDARGNAFPVRILLDSVSQANFITESCLRKGGFRRTKHSATVLAINEARAATTRGLTFLVIRARGRDDTRFSIEATVLPRITSPLPNDKVEVQSWKHLKGLPLADPEYYVPGSVDILLGADSFVSILRDGRRKGEKGEPDAFNSVFGWVLTGAVSPSVQATPLLSFATTLESIETSVGRFWQLEEVPEDASCSDEDRRCKEIFAQTTYRDPSGRFVVSYPFVSDPPTFVGSRSIAVSRLRALERRFKSDPEFRVGYNSFMQDYLDSGHMEVIRNPFPSDGHIYYLPHHGVYKLDSTTTKLRVVFNAFLRCPNGLSINETLLSGPKLQQDLLAILLRFRAEAIALTADVKQMFRQIWISPEQCDYQRIVWRFSESDPILDYLLKTVTFGFTASPFLAIYCLLQLAHQYREKYPLAFAALLEALYVDDVVTSVRTVEQARALRDQLLSLLRSAGFELRKWSSSHPAALEGLDTQLCSQSMLDFESSEDQSQKILGLRWHSQSDSFGFQVNALDRECTKRTILSEVARIFDFLGFLAPLTFTAKCLIQRLWTLKLDWDDEPPMDIRRTYILRFVNHFRAKSAPTTLAIDQLELHSALLVVVKSVQADAFRDEIDRLQSGRRLPKPLLKLAPFLDPVGILRVGGRLAKSGLTFENKHPALLPSKHRLTDLVIEHVHRTNLHPGRRTLQYLLTQHYWVLGVHRAIQRVLSRCHRCFRVNPHTSQPLMADLPADRVRRAKPFSISGVDFAGPFNIVTRRARGVSSFKVYACLFVCFSVKAVHLEAAFSLSTDSFLAALRRFVARRGRCSLLYSDCGTNFVGAARELESRMSLAAEREKIKWSFNPPSAPHFGGLWEAGVKTFKTHLRRTVGDQVLSIEEFTTVLAQVEAVLNSRPLCPMSTDPADLEVLSPGHFLTMEPLVSVPTQDVTPLPMNRLSRWQLVQRIHQDFWKRWHQEYLHTLQQRPKWWTSVNPLGIGALVLLKDANMPPLRWRRGRVEALHPGSDGVPRVATVRVADGTITRPLVKLCPLPMGPAPQATDSDR
ncbi:uncharacterized protein [Temnothorax longispinosus]|uniref:uncharacterized protein n=1 Tax=Temnothorax longispinosus TaxID=300112 RepID=UPI003A99E504